MKNIYAIGNTHFDPVWLWQWNEAMTSIHSTFRSALDRMNEDEDFIYSFATPPVFEWLKQTDPEMLDEIKQRVKEGRWELPEGWWLQPDCFSASGESYARQSLYGQKYLLENFDGYTDTVFNVDSFGHSSQTPQILKKSGMKYYCLCRPEEKHYHIDSPYFKWIGKDGSEVKAFRVGQYTEVYNKDMRAAIEQTERNMQGATCDEMMLYGVTNHGGAPTKKAIADIHALDAEKDYGIRFSSVTGYFEAQNEPSATVNGELITGDFGPYVNNRKIKKLNRIAEYSALNAERAALVAKRLLKREYPKEKLDSIWRDIMFNQFHDILGGASTKDAYVDAYNQLGRAVTCANEIKQFALAAATHKIKMPGKNPDNPWNLTVWNLNTSAFNGYVEAELQWLHEFPAYKGGIELEDADGNKYPCQIILERSVIEGFRSRILFKTEIGGMGYKTFKVIKTDTTDSISDYKKCFSLTTGAFEIDFDAESGLIKTLKNKVSGKTLNNVITPAVFEDEGDTWCFNVDGYGEKCEPLKLESFEITEKGIHRTTVKTTHSFRNSKITLYYTFYEVEAYFDIVYSVNFNEKHKVLKLIFDYGCDDLLVSSPFASEKREDTRRDIPMGEWLCTYDENGGAAIICDSAFAYNKSGSKVGISLLRSCIYGDLRISKLDKNADYPYMEQGIADGKMRVICITGAMDGSIADESTAFNNPPSVVCEANHDGIFAPKRIFAKIEADGVFVSAIKGAYEGDDEIVRLCEYLGNEQKVKINYFGEKFGITLSPFEIKTLRISSGRISEVNILEE